MILRSRRRPWRRPATGRCWTGASRAWSSGSRPASTPTVPWSKPPPSCGPFPGSARSPESKPPRSPGSRPSRGTADRCAGSERSAAAVWRSDASCIKPRSSRSPTPCANHANHERRMPDDRPSAPNRGRMGPWECGQSRPRTRNPNATQIRIVHRFPYSPRRRERKTTERPKKIKKPGRRLSSALAADELDPAHPRKCKKPARTNNPFPPRFYPEFDDREIQLLGNFISALTG